MKNEDDQSTATKYSNMDHASWMGSNAGRGGGDDNNPGGGGPMPPPPPRVPGMGARLRSTAPQRKIDPEDKLS
jgi:hypothetical protein